MKSLIVNADDFNLTRGTARGILEAHRTGIVSSTSVFANLNFEHGQCDELRKVKMIGVGVHLNVTLGRPLAQPKLIRSLVTRNGVFKKQSEFRRSKINAEDCFLEFELQLLNFRAIFGRDPDHLNTHHHLHELPEVACAVAALSRKYKIPTRRSNALSLRGEAEAISSAATRLPRRPFRAPRNDCFLFSDYFFGSLNHQNYWTEKSLVNLLKNLPNGVSELMCHPAYVDQELSRISSFSTERNKELRLFSNPKLRRMLQTENIILQTKF